MGLDGVLGGLRQSSTMRIVIPVGILCGLAAPALAESPPPVAVPLAQKTRTPQPESSSVVDEMEPAPAGEPNALPPSRAPSSPAPDRKTTPPRPEPEVPKQLSSANELELFQLDDRLAALLVTTATRTKRTADDAPAIVEVVTRQQIEEWGYQSVAEVLSKAVGFYVEDDHILPNVAVRGVSGGLLADSGVIKVLIDGRSVTFRTTTGNWLGPELIPLSAIERIEIVRGPASALYGADAFLGVVNIITRQGSAINGAQIGGGLSLQTLKPQALGTNLDATVGLSRGRLEFLAALRLQSEDRSGLALPASSPVPAIPSYNAGKTIASALDRYARVGLLRLTYNFSDQSSISVTGYLSSIDAGGEFSPWSQLAAGLDSVGRKNENRISLLHGWVSAGLKLKITPQLRLQWDATAFVGAPTDRDRVEVGNLLYFVRRQFGYRGFDSTLELQWQPRDSLTFVGGVGAIVDEERAFASLQVLKLDTASQKAGDILNAASSPTDSHFLTNFGAYVQAQWKPLQILSLTAGVRFDYHNIYGSQGSGRAAVVLSPKNNLHIKVLYGTAFKSPSPLLLYGVPTEPGDVIGNPELKAQYIHTIEAGLSYHPINSIRLSTDLAYSFLLDTAAFSPVGVNHAAVNVGRINALSWESKIEAFYRSYVWGYLSLEVNYTLRDAGYEGYRAMLFGIDNVIYPRVVFHSGVQARIPKLPLRFGAQLSYVGARRASEDNILLNGASYELPDYVLLGATISTVDLKLWSNRETTLQVVAKNLLGVTGPDPGFSGIDYPLAPTSFFFMIRQQVF